MLGNIESGTEQVSFSDAGWVSGSYTGLEVVASPNFRVKNKISLENSLFNSTDARAVAFAANSVFFHLSQNCVLSAYEQTKKKSAKYTPAVD